MEAAFFDLDKTVIAKASMMAFGRPFYREGLISRRSLVRGLWAQLIYAEALELIELHKAAGRRVYIISASPEELVEPLSRFLGADEALSSKARLDDEGRYTGEMDVYAYGPFKVDIIREVASRDGID